MLYIEGFAPDSTQMIFHIGFRMSVCLDFYVTIRSFTITYTTEDALCFSVFRLSFSIPLLLIG